MTLVRPVVPRYSLSVFDCITDAQKCDYSARKEDVLNCNQKFKRLIIVVAGARNLFEIELAQVAHHEQETGHPHPHLTVADEIVYLWWISDTTSWSL